MDWLEMKQEEAIEAATPYRTPSPPPAPEWSCGICRRDYQTHYEARLCVESHHRITYSLLAGGREFFCAGPDGRVFVDGHEASDTEIASAVREWALALASTVPQSSVPEPEKR